jgi:hypothetical protein
MINLVDKGQKGGVFTKISYIGKVTLFFAKNVKNRQKIGVLKYKSLILCYF